MKFSVAVQDTPELARHLHSDLDALDRAHLSRIVVSPQKRLCGSVNIDDALRQSLPNAHRWDYAIGYRVTNKVDRTFYAEFHRAEPGEVPNVSRKKDWLDEWIKGNAMARLEDRVFAWVSAGPIRFPPNSPVRRVISSRGLRLVRRLCLE